MNKRNKKKNQRLLKARHFANLAIVSFLLLSPIFFVSVSVLEGKNASGYILSSEEQNERSSSSEEKVNNNSTFFLNTPHKSNISIESIKSQSFSSSDVLVKSRPKDDVRTPPPRFL